MNSATEIDQSIAPYTGVCDACGHTSWHFVKSAHAGSYHRCKSCRYHIQVTDEKQHEKFEAEQKKHYDTDSLCTSPIFQLLEERKLSRRIDLLSRVIKSGHLIEVGPGRGGMLAKTIDLGYKVDAVEHSSVMAEQIEEEYGINVMVGEFEQLEISSDKYDAYMSYHVVEHVADVIAHFKKANSIVKLGGLAIIATPNADSLEHRLPFGVSPHYSSAHLQLFSKKSMREALKSTGWEVVEISTPSYVEYWIRVITSTVRLLKFKIHGKKIERGRFVDMVPAKSGKQFKLFQAANLLTWPLRKLQEKILTGGELLVVARKI